MKPFDTVQVGDELFEGLSGSHQAGLVYVPRRAKLPLEPQYFLTFEEVSEKITQIITGRQASTLWIACRDHSREKINALLRTIKKTQTSGCVMRIQKGVGGHVWDIDL